MSRSRQTRPSAAESAGSCRKAASIRTDLRRTRAGLANRMKTIMFSKGQESSMRQPTSTTTPHLRELLTVVLDRLKADQRDSRTLSESERDDRETDKMLASFY